MPYEEQPRVVWNNADRIAHGFPPIEPAKSKPASVKLDLYRFTPIDAAALAELDPVMPTAAVLYRFPSTGPEAAFEVPGLFRAEPIGAEGKPDGALSLATMERVLEEVGYEDDGVSTDDFITEGTTAARPYMPTNLSSLLSLFRGEHNARLYIVESICRSFGMSPSAVSALTGREYKPGKLLIPSGLHCDRLRESRRAAVEAAEQTAKLAAAMAAERARPRSLRELGYEGIAVKQRLGVVVQNPLQPHKNWNDEGEGSEGFLLWHAVPGLELPEGWQSEHGYVRALPSSHTVAPDTWGHPFSPDVLAFVLRARRSAGFREDLPIESFTLEGVELGEKLLEASRQLVLNGETWKRQILAQQLTRGLRIRPDKVIEMIVSRIDRLHKGHYPDYEVRSLDGLHKPDVIREELIHSPLRGRDRLVVAVRRHKHQIPPLPASAWKPSEIEATIFAALKGGAIQPGCLLPNAVKPSAAAQSGKKVK
jgi:hypothetical protein